MDSNSTCYLYWIRKDTDRCIFTDGYIGITTDPEYRWKSHLYTSKITNKNHRLYNSLRKNPEAFNMQILVCTTVENCLELEHKLRPIKNIGLNHAEGGRPTSNGRLNYNFTQDVKDKISQGVKKAYRENKEFANKQKACKIGKAASDSTKSKMSESAKKSDRTKWRNNAADQEMWFYADKFYKLFKENIEIMPKDFALTCKLPLAKINALLKSFRKGWNPTEDKEYLKFKETYYGNRTQF